MKHWLFFLLIAALFFFGCCLKPHVPCLPGL